ncbi:MAG: hypothetical protein HKN04_07830 [Rhodothermaceae bacterium]|nr:hypothetical protein [Rhodothermaceae bacterium]
MRPDFARLLPLLLFALGLTALTGCGGTRPTAPPMDPTDPALVVAEYADQTLTLREFEQAYTSTTGDAESAQNDSLAAYQDFLERYVNFKLKVMRARELGYAEDSTLQAEIADYRDQLARPYFTDQAILDDIIADLYEKQQEEINASHLLIRVEETAAPEDTLAAYQRTLALRDSVVLHGMAFDEMAFRHSEDPSARRNRGNLGYFSGGRMVEAFEEAAYATPVGEITMPIRTRFGYHLMYVSDRRARTADIRASHILIRVQGDQPADSAAARQQIEELKARIEAGEDFATLARQYSDDVASGQRGGDLGFFGVGRMVPPFNEAAFALEEPGDLSDIVETRFGFHLIRLEERQALPTYEEAYPELKRLAGELPRTALRQRQLGEEEREAAGFAFDSTLVANALNAFDADSLFLQLRNNGFGEQSAAVFASIGDESYTLGDFGDYFQRRGVRPGPDQRAQVLDEMDAYLSEQGFERALEQLENRDPAFRDLLGQYVDGVLLFRISEDSVWTPAAEDDAGLRAYYETNRGNYQWPERRRTLAYTSPSDSMLTLVAADLDAGLSAAEILARYEDSPLTLRLDTLYLADSTNSPVDASLGLAVGERTEIVPERSRLAVYWLDGIEVPREKTFDEARAELVTAYQDLLEAAWVARLRERYDARTYPERLLGAFHAPAMEMEGAIPPPTAGTSGQ